MTERDYLHYEMNKDELVKWKELVNDIKNSFHSIADISGIPYQIFSEILDITTMAKEPWYGTKGYINNKGFYCVAERDKGAIEMVYSGYSYEMAKINMVKRCADRISYAYVTDDIKGLQEKYRGLWRYCRINDGIEKINGLTRMKSHLEEQQNWIYDGEYDYRVYWFEPSLFMVKRILDNDEYEKTVAYYEECMNYRSTSHWKYNRLAEKFEIIETNR